MSLLVNLFPIGPCLLATVIVTRPCYNKKKKKGRNGSSELTIIKKASLPLCLDHMLQNTCKNFLPVSFYTKHSSKEVNMSQCKSKDMWAMLYSQNKCCPHNPAVSLLVNLLGQLCLSGYSSCKMQSHHLLVQHQLQELVCFSNGPRDTGGSLNPD